MDIKEQVTKAVEKITKDKELQEQFKTEPAKALESILGILLNLPYLLERVRKDLYGLQMESDGGISIKTEHIQPAGHI